MWVFVCVYIYICMHRGNCRTKAFLLWLLGQLHSKLSGPRKEGFREFAFFALAKSHLKGRESAICQDYTSFPGLQHPGYCYVQAAYLPLSLYLCGVSHTPPPQSSIQGEPNNPFFKLVPS